MRVSALFVDTGGVYFDAGGVEPWDELRDARRYPGPYPVVAHPPCARWCRFWFGGPLWVSRGNPPKQLGDDDGCFDSALRAVRTFGGVLEHPAYSHAWKSFRIRKPDLEGWIKADLYGGWTCHVEQGHYGHRARKPTWLYAVGCVLPDLKWGRSDANARWSKESSGRAMARIKKDERMVFLSHKERSATPLEFRDLLLSMARSVQR